jgi:hypothetical protein
MILREDEFSFVPNAILGIQMNFVLHNIICKLQFEGSTEIMGLNLAVWQMNLGFFAA